MKSTGITRNLDDVGRLVIPREIRKTLKLKQGTPMEIFIDSNNELILRKISPVFELQSTAKVISKLIYDIFHLSCVVCDLDNVLAVSGTNKKEFLDKLLNDKFVKLIYNRTKKYISKNEEILITTDAVKYSNFALSPIIIESNCYGCVIIFNSQHFIYNDKFLLKLAEFVCECIKL